METVAVALSLSDQFLSDVLVTAFDANFGGCWYWAVPWEHRNGTSAWLIDGEIWREVRIREREPSSTEARRIFHVNHGMLAQGILRLFEHIATSENLSVLRSAVIDRDAGAIDSSGADFLVQLACFGGEVYG